MGSLAHAGVFAAVHEQAELILCFGVERRGKLHRRKRAGRREGP